ncbi:MAG: aminoacyl-tRNA hydrolase [Weeksellaceae bacterium]
MKYVFVGLGNPGDKYQQTRHNVGFLFVDYFASALINSSKDAPYHSPFFKHDSYVNAEILKHKTLTNEYIFVKPQTFMNLSGEAVKNVLKHNNLDPSSLTVIHDDLDVVFGKFKIQPSAGPKVHNGLSSIEQHLKTAEFTRVRIGVDNRDGDRSLSGEQYVLGNFNAAEKETLTDVFSQISARLQQDLKL